jgi:hypothetical protein
LGETRVDLHHLLEDLHDAYPGAREETILAEVVANSLDSGATTTEDHVQLYDFVFLDQSGIETHTSKTFAALASSFTENKHRP